MNIITELKDVVPNEINYLRLKHWCQLPYILNIECLSNNKRLFLTDSSTDYSSPNINGMELYNVDVKIERPYIFIPKCKEEAYELIEDDLLEIAKELDSDCICYINKLESLKDYCFNHLTLFHPKDKVIAIKKIIEFNPIKDNKDEKWIETFCKLDYIIKYGRKYNKDLYRILNIIKDSGSIVDYIKSNSFNELEHIDVCELPYIIRDMYKHNEVNHSIVDDVVVKEIDVKNNKITLLFKLKNYSHI